MRQSKKELRLLEKYAALSGKSLDELKAGYTAAKQNNLDKENPHRSKSMQMEAALHFIRQPQGYVARECLECGETFGTNYYHVAYCSDTCRARDWERKMKMPWNAEGKSLRDKYLGEPPVIIHPQVWNNMYEIIQQMQVLRQENKAQVEEPEEVSEPEHPEDNLDHPMTLFSLEEDSSLDSSQNQREEHTLPTEESHEAVDTIPLSEPFPLKPSLFSEIPSFSHP